MTDYRTYLNNAQKYLDLASEIDENEDRDWLLIPAIIMSWASIESFVNNMMDDFSRLPPDLFELHERSLLLEERIRFIDEGKDAGKFILKGNDFKRLEEKILFLIWKFNPDKQISIKGNKLWNRFVKFKTLRDSIVHPRRSKDVLITYDDSTEFRNTAIEIIGLIAEKVWKKPLVI